MNGMLMVPMHNDDIERVGDQYAVRYEFEDAPTVIIKSPDDPDPTITDDTAFVYEISISDREDMLSGAPVPIINKDRTYLMYCPEKADPQSRGVHE